MQKRLWKVRIHSYGDGSVVSPVIGENGKWYIGNDDIVIRAEEIDEKAGETGL